MSKLKQVLDEADIQGEVTTLVSYNGGQEKVWQYGEIIPESSVVRALSLGVDIPIRQGNWRNLKKIHSGYLVPLRKFQPTQKGWVLLIGLKISPLEETAIHFQFPEGL